jgi:anti-sigma regulatory factor (Ser/Thr protein kinase)
LKHAHESQQASSSGHAPGFRHDAVFYRGECGFLPSVLPFVSSAVERDEPVLVAVIPARAEALRNELGDRAKHVEFVDMQSAGRNPARIIPVWNDFAARHARGGKALNGVGEPIWKDRTPAEIAECQRHESLLNLAFATAESFALLCPYDEAGLASDVVAAARESHPHVVHSGRRGVSSDYHGIADIDGCDSRPLPAPPALHEARAFGARDITALRRDVGAWAAAHGAGSSRADDLSLAVHEAAVNSIRHGGGRGVLRLWTSGRVALCEIEDAGRIGDPLAGRLLPPADSGTGRGLWLINHLCDLVQIRATATGTVVRLHQELDEAATA